MKLAILAVGHKPPAWVAAGCAEYVKRMPRELPLSVVEVKPEPRGSKSREQLLAAEKNPSAGRRMQGCGRMVVLDERGVDLPTLKLAERLARLDASRW
jgi:23S rRNA (pseudouridine1915-N3)-methyltransferase